VLCSTATRTRQTLDGLHLGTESEISFEPQIYHNDVDTLLDLLRAAGDDARTVLLIGHNPSLHQLVIDLTTSDIERFPTSACAALSVDGPWANLASGGARLISLWTPKTA
jgi:phosphohistidine phosphatase